MWDYNPKDAKDVLEAGVYPAAISRLVEGTSKSSNKRMLTITWLIDTPDRRYFIDDYIVDPNTLWKLKRIAICFHKGIEFEQGVFDISEHLNEMVNLQITVQTSDQYGDRNNVKGYLNADETIPAKPTGPLAPPPSTDADIPF